MLKSFAMSGQTQDHHTLGQAVPQVQQLFDAAIAGRASDIHIEPVGGGYVVRYRVDGLLEDRSTLDAALGRSVVSRLMVLAELLTYRADVPQEGHIKIERETGGPIDVRLSVMPTTHGLRAVLRFPALAEGPRTLDDLGLSENVIADLHAFSQADMGMLLLVGPAGSGKTTTIYALLERLLAEQVGLSVVSLEDPVERDLPGVTQIQITPFGELTYPRVLRSVLRQDPQVLVVGEIRDADTASIAVQAALSGHRLISTLHAGSPAQAIARLLEMGLEPYQVTSALFGVVSQRLLRRREGQGYRGRFAVAESGRVDEALRRMIVGGEDANALKQALHARLGYQTIDSAARRAVGAGLTDEAEVRRVLGREESISE